MLRDFMRQNRRILCFLLFIPVILIFFLAEARNCERIPIHCAADDWIPFLPVFIIPYVLWYLYIPFLLGVICFTDPLAFRRQCVSFFGGAGICLLIILVFPTRIDFRPEIPGGGTNLFEWMCSVIFRLDDPVNVFPSMHCFEAVCVHLTAFSVPQLRKKTGWRMASATLSVLICLSTVFIKQHSVLDLIAGVLLAVLLSLPVMLRNRRIIQNDRTSV